VFWETDTESAEGGRTLPFRTDDPPWGEFCRASTSGLLISMVPTTSPTPGNAVAEDAVPRVGSEGRSPTNRAIDGLDGAGTSAEAATAPVATSPTTHATTSKGDLRTAAS